jgi:transcriptional regulator with XRE-family HTH domain
MGQEEGTNMAETMGQRLKDLRAQAGLTQEALAARSGLPVGTIRNWEQGQRIPGALALYRLAQALGLPMERFVEGVEEGKPPAAGRGRPRGRKGKGDD